MSADHRVVLYKNGRWTWDEIDQPSQRLIEHFRNDNWARDAVGELGDGHSEIFARQKSRAYRLGTMGKLKCFLKYFEFDVEACCGISAIGWSPIFKGSSPWAWFVTLQRSGHIVVWRAEAAFDQLSLVDVYNLQVADPSALKVYRGCNGKSQTIC